MKKYELSVDMSQDMFLGELELGENHWSMLMGCYHQGQCENDAKEALEVFNIADYNKAFDYIESCGIEMDDFYTVDEDDFFIESGESETVTLDEEKVGMYYLWMLSGNIQDEAKYE